MHIVHLRVCNVCGIMLIRGGEKLPQISEAKKRANKKWNDANMTERYDRLNILVPKGRKAAIQAASDAAGQSLNGFVTTAIDERIERLGGSQTVQEVKT